MPMIGACPGPLEAMRVTTAKASGADDRVFTVVVESLGTGVQRRAERRFNVPFSQLQPLMQTIARSGGRIRVVIHEAVSAAASAPGGGEQAAAPAPTTPPEAAAVQAAPTKPAAKAPVGRRSHRPSEPHHLRPGWW
jgi:hypothetical protein